MREKAKFLVILLGNTRADGYSMDGDVEQLNTVLRRGMGLQRAMEQKRALISELPGRESDIKRVLVESPEEARRLSTKTTALRNTALE
jgi:hypothetical protein